jgi:hypothetical protein
VKNLKKYIDQRNFYREWAKKPPYDADNLSVRDMADLYEDLSCDLSPENLCCDGELRGAALNRKTKFLNAAHAELTAHASSRGHTLALKGIRW